jgi:hypothetical protein
MQAPSVQRFAFFGAEVFQEQPDQPREFGVDGYSCLKYSSKNDKLRSNSPLIAIATE